MRWPPSPSRTCFATLAEYSTSGVMPGGVAMDLVQDEARKRVPEALGLSSAQVEDALQSAASATSLHNAQPWRFRLTTSSVELHADPDRRLRRCDPDDRELRLGCGAALFNLRMGLEHVGVRPLVKLLPDAAENSPLAVVRRGGRPNPAMRQSHLYRAITACRPNCRRFLPYPVPESHLEALVRSVQPERSWVHVVERSQSARLHNLLRRAGESTAAFRAERNRWTGAQGERDRPQPESADHRDVNGRSAVRNCSHGFGRPQSRDVEHEPLLLALCSYGGSPVDDIQAGQALQRLLLTATSLGLSASFLPEITEVPSTAQKLRTMLGGSLCPQLLIRVGYGSPVPPLPRRRTVDLLFGGHDAAAEGADLDVTPRTP